MIDSPDLSDVSTLVPTIRKLILLEGKYIWGWDVSDTERAQTELLYRNKVISYMNTASSNVVHDLDIAEKFCYTYSDGSEKPPAPVFDLIEHKNGISFKRYKEQVKEGKILMSAYDRYSIRVKSTPGYRKTLSFSRTSHLTTGALIEAGILTVIVDYFGVPKLAISGTGFGVEWSGNNPNISIATYARDRSDGEWVFPTAPSASYFLNTITGHNPDRKSVVTRASAYANRRSLDVLTAFAEMPKTIGSVLRGMARIAGIIKDFKKGEFNLSKAHARRKKILSDQYHKDQRFIQRRLNDKSLNQKQRDYWLRKQEQSTFKLSVTLRDAAIELADELASLWLNFRYNIMPNVYLLQDIERALARFDQTFITARSKSVSKIVFSGPGWRFDEDFIVRVVIKRRFGDPSRFTTGGPQISADIFTTAWELVPLSFVVDWFVRIGDFLAAFSFKNDWDQEGNCMTDLVKINQDIALFPDDTWLIPPKVRVEGFYYKRILINPTDYIGLCWQPTIGLERKIDALALIWRPVRSSLKR